MSLHRRTHPVFQEGCFGCKAASIDFSAEAMPNRKPAPVEIEATEKRWHKDHAAYERLVAQGYQPPRLDGCAYREAHAVKRMDIEHPAPTSFGQKPSGAFEAIT
jgi:hypothetical protein